MDRVLIKYLYECCDDIVLILGDLNGRIGEKSDNILGLDDIPNRVCIDKTVNDHGRALIS